MFLSVSLAAALHLAYGIPAALSRRLRALLGGDEGMSTAEYAIGTVAAAAFGMLLYTVVTSDSVTAALTSLVDRALAGEF